MKFLKYAVLIALSSTAFGGNDSGVGGGKGKTAEELAGIDNPALDLDNLLGGIPTDSLLKDIDGETTLIPLDNSAIRRLKLRASVTGSTPLVLDSGEKFLLRRDAEKDRLIDIKKVAEVIEKSSWPTGLQKLVDPAE